MSRTERRLQARQQALNVDSKKPRKLRGFLLSRFDDYTLSSSTSIPPCCSLTTNVTVAMPIPAGTAIVFGYSFAFNTAQAIVATVEKAIVFAIAGLCFLLIFFL